MPFSLFIISNIILHSHMLPSFKRHQNTSQMLSGHKHPEQKSRGCWGSYPVPASTAFSKFSIIWTWGRKKMVKRGGRLDRQADIRTWQRQPERKRRERHGERKGVSKTAFTQVSARGCAGLNGIQDLFLPPKHHSLCSPATLPSLFPPPKHIGPLKFGMPKLDPAWDGSDKETFQSNRVRNRLKKREHEKIDMGRRKGREREGDAETRMNLSGKPFSHYKVNLLGAGMGKVWEGCLPTLLHLRWGQAPWEVQWGPFLCPLLCN